MYPHPRLVPLLLAGLLLVGQRSLVAQVKQEARGSPTQGEACSNPIVIDASPSYFHLGAKGGGRVVYRFATTDPARKEMTFYVEPRGGWKLTLAAFSPACESARPVAVASVAGPGGAESLALPVTPGVPIYLVVEGVDGAKGEYSFLAYSRDDPLCQVIVSPPLAAAPNFNQVRGLPADRKVEVHRTYQINSPSPCHQEYLVPWPRSQNTPAGPKFLWITDARIKKGAAAASLNTPASARAIVQLVGHYTVQPKRPEDIGKTVRCEADFVLRGNQWLKSDAPLGVSVSKVKSRILVQPFAGLVPYNFESTKSCVSSAFVFPACEIGGPVLQSVNDVQGPFVADVPLGVPQLIDFTFISYSARAWDGLAASTLVSFDLHLECPDPPFEAKEGGATYPPVDFRIEDTRTIAEPID